MRFVNSKPVLVRHPALGSVATKKGEVTGGKLVVEVPQFDSMDEFIKACEGDTGALKYVNKLLAAQAKRNAVNVGKSQGKEETKDTVISKILAAAKETTPLTTINRGTGVAAKAAAFDELATALASAQQSGMSQDDLLKMLLAKVAGATQAA